MKRLFIIGAFVSLAGCAAHAPWVNTKLPKSQWDKDWSTCKRAAEYRTSGMKDWDAPTSSDPWADYDRQKAKEVISSQVASCMIGLGYLPVEKKK